MKEKIMAGIDLHSNNLVCALIDGEGNRLGQRRLPCQISEVNEYLKPYQERLEVVAVESTFNWYWLVDGLKALNYPVVLANPAGIQQYQGIKRVDDKCEPFFLAELCRLNILPTGWICEPETRAVRDLLRRRSLLVRNRTSLILSFKSLHARNTGQSMPLTRIRAMSQEEVGALYEHWADDLAARLEFELIEHFDASVKAIEKEVLQTVALWPAYRYLQTISGIGEILGMTIALETGDIGRFASAGDYASYARCVDSKRETNGKKKGRNNSKCGNKYLGWAFVEAAQFARRFNLQCRQFYDRKCAQTNNIVAIKALACKLAKAAYCVMKEQTPFNLEKVFPHMKIKSE